MNDQIAGYLKLNVGNAQTEPKGEDYLEIQKFISTRLIKVGKRTKVYSIGS